MFKTLQFKVLYGKTEKLYMDKGGINFYTPFYRLFSIYVKSLYFAFLTITFLQYFLRVFCWCTIVILFGDKLKTL